MSKLISIVLPVYNGARFLRESIDSVLNQTYTNWELLILDDCSTDETPSIAQEYAEKDSRIFYYRNERNLRLPGNLNRGFSLAKGDYLTWTSDDNRYRPTALEKMLQTLTDNPGSDLVYASYQVIGEAGNPIQVLEADPRGKEHILGSNVVGACFLYTRKVYEEIGEYDVDLLLVEDFDYWQRVLMKFDGLAIAEILYDYRWHAATLTSTKNEKQFGQRMEKLLLKNRPGFGKLSLEATYYYYSALVRSYEYQDKPNLYARKWQLLRLFWNCKRIVNKFRRK